MARRDAALTWRQTALVFLGLAILLNFLLLAIGVLDALAGRGGPVLNGVTATGAAALLVLVPTFAIILRAEIRGRRSGTVASPARVNPWLKVGFGLAIAAVGFGASRLTANWAVAAGGGTYYVYWGIILFGIAYAFIAFGDTGDD